MINNITTEMPIYWFLLSISTSILITKIFLGIKSLKLLKGEFKFDIRLGLALMCIFLFIARIFWTYLDFHLTQFNTHGIYEVRFNSYIFKAATISIGLGLLSIVWSIEVSELKLKLKGIPSITLIFLLILIIISPLSNLIEFNKVAKLQLYMNLFGLFIPIVFFTKAFRDDKLRKWYILGGLGTIIYALGANLLNEVIMMALRKNFGNLALYINYSLLLLFKSAGLYLLYRSVKTIGSNRAF